MTKSDLPTLCLDFDGVVHDYTKGWQDGAIYGELTPGFRKWLERARMYFKVVIHTSRADNHRTASGVRIWLADRGITGIDIVAKKPPAFVTIDDRAVTFTGSWDDFDVLKLRAFRPWNVAPIPSAE